MKVDEIVGPVNPDADGQAEWNIFADWLGAHDGRHWAFRGVRSDTYKLIPKIGRTDLRKSGLAYVAEGEAWLLDTFILNAGPMIPAHAQPRTMWEWLAHAQHHGLPTRLLDWTRNVLVAAYFAVEEDDTQSDCAIYAWRAGFFLEKQPLGHPFEIKDIGFFDPPRLSQRIIAQQGLFSIHPNPTDAFVHPDLHQLKISWRFKQHLKSRLYNLGVTRSSLFSDLDGFTQTLSWAYATSYNIEWSFPGKIEVVPTIKAYERG